jgi:hypothetical protein
MSPLVVTDVARVLIRVGWPAGSIEYDRQWRGGVVWSRLSEKVVRGARHFVLNS